MVPSSSRAALAAALLPCLAAAAPEPAQAPVEDRALAALALALAVSPLPEAAAGRGAAPGAPALEVAATVRVDALVFEEAPRVKVSLAAGARRVSWRAEVSNLPAEIEPGAIYRDVEVRLHLAGAPEAIAEILRDATLLASGIRMEPPPGDTSAPALPPAAAR
jgi:hypothetical protein